MLDVYRAGCLTVRKALVLALQLPSGAQTWISMGSDAAWTTEAHLTAVAIDQLVGGNWQRGGGKGKQPKPMERPADIKKKQDRKDAAVAKAERFAARHGVPQQIEPPPAKRPRDERGRFIPTKRARDERGRFISRKG